MKPEHRTIWHAYYNFMEIESPSMRRKMFGCFSKSLVPAPIPTRRSVKLGGRASIPWVLDCFVKVFSSAAPVGVTNSPVTPGGP